MPSAIDSVSAAVFHSRSDSPLMLLLQSNFTPNSQLLAWINFTLGLSLQKIEDTANGAVACQLMDAIHRNQGGVSLKQVDFNAKTEYEALNNYKVLQQAFLKYGVNKSADSAKLVKGKPLDNLEFMQWFKVSANSQY